MVYVDREHDLVVVTHRIQRGTQAVFIERVLQAIR